MEILGAKIERKSSHYLQMDLARLHTRDTLKVPVIIERSKKDGPTVLLLAGVHGNELNGVEIVRQIISKKLNKPKRGTIICIPVLNVFGFLNQDREFPDGRDMNRVFPGSATGSLASQFAYNFRTRIAPHVDYVLDFHTGGADRVNIPQIRCAFKNTKNVELAKVFGTKFIMDAKVIPKSLRATLEKMNIPTLLFEGGKTSSFEESIIEEGVNGAVRVLNHLGVTDNPVDAPNESVIITTSKWLRATYSGMLHLKINFGDSGKKVSENTLLAIITDPFGKFTRKIKAPYDCHIFCVNTAPIVNKGDAVFHIAKL